MKELTMRNGEVVDAEATAIGLTTDCPDCPGRVVHVEGSSWSCLRCGYSTTMTLAEDTDA